jgi:pimeloyl-ACP methyl ester carboxylesterase
VRRLILVTPSGRVLGVPMIGFEEAVAARSAEPWYADAIAADAALEDLPDDADLAERVQLLARVTPFFYGRWDAAAAAHSVAFPHVDAAATGYYRDFTSDAPAVRAQLAAMAAPTLVVAGEVDGMPTPAVADVIAKVFRNGRAATVPGGHYPWVDDPAVFVTTIKEFLEA